MALEMTTKRTVETNRTVTIPLEDILKHFEIPPHGKVIAHTPGSPGTFREDHQLSGHTSSLVITWTEREESY